MRKGKQFLVFTLCFCLAGRVQAQTGALKGQVTSGETPVELVNIKLAGSKRGVLTDNTGAFFFSNVPCGQHTLLASSVGYHAIQKEISIKPGDTIILNLSLTKDTKTLNEIVVTGVSRATLIRENPVPVVAVSAGTLEQSMESNVVDVLSKKVPGLNSVKTGPNVSKPFIRGLGYNRVLTLYDGVRQEGQQWGDEHGLEIDAYNIERAEVIKGPASLMYGSDALAGVVSLFPFIPNQKDEKLRGKFTGEYQSNNNLIGSGIHLDYGSKRLLFALRGSFRKAANFRNAIDGRVYNTGFEEKNFSGLVGYRTGRGHSLFNFSLYDNLQGIPDGSRDSLSRRFTRQIAEGDDDDIKNRPVVSAKELNSYHLSPLHQHIRHYRAYMRHNYRLGGGQLDFLWGLQQNIREEHTHPLAPEQPGMNLRLNTMNYGLRYNAPVFENIELSAGLNGMVQGNKSIHATDFPIPDYRLFDGGMYVYAKRKQNRWTASGGVRYDVRQVQWKDFYLTTDPETGFDKRTYPSEDPLATLQFPAYQKTFHGVSASIGFTYEITKNISLKANVGRGYRAPNISEMASNGLDPGAHIIYIGNRNFKPEFSMQEDMGISARFSNFSGDVSIFNNHIKNYIYLTMLTDENGQATIDPQGNKTFQYRQAAAQLFGMEAWFSVHPKDIPGLRLDNSLSVVYGFNRKSAYRGKGVDGAYLPLIPPLKFISSVAHTFSLRNRFVTSVTPLVEWQYSGAQNRYLRLNDTETRTPAYSLLDVGISADIRYSKGKNLLLRIGINNLFDEAYQSHTSRLKYFEYYSASPNKHLGIFDMGRSLSLKLAMSF